MRDLIILGAGVHAAEMAEIVERVNGSLKKAQRWNLLGYVTHDGKKAGERLNGLPILGGKENLDEHPAAALVPDNSWPRSLEVPRERLVSLVDPSSFVSRTARIGVGCAVYPHCYIGFNARIGDFLFCLSGAVINHDDVIDDRVVIASGASLAGYVHVEPDCYVGQGSTCRQYLTIGRGSLIGMGAVVVRNVEPNSVMVGNPARKLRDREKPASS